MRLIDRTAEMEVVQGLLDDVRAGSSGVLLLRGQPGIGKTALLEETAERAAAAGMRIAHCVGSQAEQGFDFAGLHQLLVPFLSGLPDLPVPQRAALETVFGLAAGQPSSPFLVGLATLTLLTDAAEKQPVLCLTDDASTGSSASAGASSSPRPSPTPVSPPDSALQRRLIMAHQSLPGPHDSRSTLPVPLTRKHFSA